VLCSDMDDAMSSFGGADKPDVHGPGLQNERATWHAVDHRTFHQLRRRHADSVQPAGTALDRARRCLAVPAQQLRLGSFQNVTHAPPLLPSGRFFIVLRDRHVLCFVD